MENKSEIQNDIKIRLNILIWLLIDLLKRDNEKIPLSALSNRLKSFGLGNEEIAVLIERTPKQVAKIVYEAKRIRQEGGNRNVKTNKK